MAFIQVVSSDQPLAADRLKVRGPILLTTAQDRRPGVWGGGIPSLIGQVQRLDISTRCWCLALWGWMAGHSLRKGAPAAGKIRFFFRNAYTLMA